MIDPAQFSSGGILKENYDDDRAYKQALRKRRQSWSAGEGGSESVANTQSEDDPLLQHLMGLGFSPEEARKKLQNVRDFDPGTKAEPLPGK